MAVRPIDLAFMNDINKARSGMSFSPRATYGSTAPVANGQITNNPVRITVNPSGVLPKPQLVQPNVVPQNTNAFSGLLGNNFTDPKTMGLLGASAELLKAGGYSVGKPAPTMGEALGNAMTTGMANYLAVQQAQQKANAPISVGKDTMLITRDGKVLMDNRSNEPFKGSGATIQSFNAILEIAPKIKDGTATPAEIAKYKLAFGNVQKEKYIPIPNDEGGVDYVKEAPQRLDGFPNPFGETGNEKKVVGEKPSAQKLKILENKPKLNMMLGNLNRYRSKLSDLATATQASGAFGIPTAEASKVSAMAEKLRLDIKNLYELGALVGGDFQILDNLLTSPTSSQGVMMGSSGLIAQLSELEETLVSKLNSYGVTGNIGSFSSPIKVSSEDAWKNATPNLYYKLPDGKIVLKGRK
jgi:hypothetical protein